MPRTLIDQSDSLTLHVLPFAAFCGRCVQEVTFFLAVSIYYYSYLLVPIWIYLLFLARLIEYFYSVLSCLVLYGPRFRETWNPEKPPPPKRGLVVRFAAGISGAEGQC